MDIRKILAAAFLENELSGNLTYAYRFSDPDGVRSGKSGWSFGRCQFDLQNNTMAKQCLAAAGFTPAEIAGLVNQTHGGAAMTALAKRLQSPPVMAVIDEYDNRQLDETIAHTRAVLANAGLSCANEEAFVHCCDYHNQFHLSYGGKCVLWLQRLHRLVTAQDLLDYKLTTLWGQKRPDDVARRWNNIHCLCAGR